MLAARQWYTIAMSTPLVSELAEEQLHAYNAADLDAFCACYHSEIIVLSEEGEQVVSGSAAFKERYAPLFAKGSEAFGASVDMRVISGRHIVEREQYWRLGEDGSREEGEVLVRYTERDGLIATAQFFK